MVVRFAQVYQISNRFGIFKRILKVFKLLLLVGEIEVASANNSVKIIVFILVTLRLQSRQFDLFDLLDGLSEWQQIELVIDCNARLAALQAENEAFVETRLHYAMRLSSVPIVHVHRYRIKLFQTCQSVEKHDNHATTFDSFHGSAQHVGRDGFEVLQDAHAERLSENLVRVLIIAIPNVFTRHEQLDCVDFIFVQISFRFELFDLLDALFLGRRNLELILVAPEHGGLGFDARFGQHLVQIYDLVETAVADYQKETAMVKFDTIFDEDPNPLINLLLHIYLFYFILTLQKRF